MNESHEPVAASASPQHRALRPAGRWTAFAAGVGIAVIAGASIVMALPSGQAPLTERDVRAAVQRALASQVPGPPFSALVYDTIMPSIVLIRTDRPGASPSPPSQATTDDVGTPPSDDPELGGIGTGVVVAAGGEVLTSWHVVDGSSLIEVTFADGSTSHAMVIVARPEDDIAVLRPLRPPAEAVPATLGNPNALRVGSEAYVVGHPYGLAGSLSSGVISGLGRSFRHPATGRTLNGLIQVDAAVNPGNSGGPLLNRRGHVTGVVTALLNPNQDDVFIGIGLAVPIDVAAGAAGMPAY